MIEIEVRVGVVPGDLGVEMTPSERVFAQNRKIADILIVLERDKALVRQAILDRLGGLTREGADAPFNGAELALEFQDAMPIVRVSLEKTAGAGAGAKRVAIIDRLSVAVEMAVAEHIRSKATHTGRWEAKVSVLPKAPELKDRSEKIQAPRQGTAGKSSGWLTISLAGLFLAAIGYVYYVYFVDH